MLDIDSLHPNDRHKAEVASKASQKKRGGTLCPPEHQSEAINMHRFHSETLYKVTTSRHQSSLTINSGMPRGQHVSICRVQTCQNKDPDGFIWYTRGQINDRDQFH